jgi:hypothetical protein
MKKLALIVGALALPLVSFAASADFGGLIESLGSLSSLIAVIIPILFSLALLGFFYGVIMYIWGKEDNKEQAKKTMIWGIVALFVMSSVWGLVAFVQNAVGVGTDAGVDTSTLIPK